MAACSMMTHIVRNITHIAKLGVPATTQIPLRDFHTSKRICLREIQEETKENVTTVEGIKIQADTSNTIKDTCLCKMDLNLKYTDVLILSQFLRPDGCLLPRRVTGICSYQQQNLKKLVHQAQRAGLMPNLRPDLKDGRQRTSHMSNFKWRRYNVYFEDK